MDSLKTSSLQENGRAHVLFANLFCLSEISFDGSRSAELVMLALGILVEIRAACNHGVEVFAEFVEPRMLKSNL